MTGASTPATLPGRRLAGRGLLVVLTCAGAVVGGWAEAAPAAFYRTFPGFGRHWLSPLGPYNEHLIRDVGALNLALGAAALVAAIILTRAATATAAIAWLVYSLPHLAFHATHGMAFSTSENVAMLTALAVPPVAAIGALWLVVSQSQQR